MVSLSANFLWGGRSQFYKMHLVKMDTISRPKRSGGWGLLHMRSFGKALLCNSLQRGIFGKGKWSSIINQKYLKGKPLVYWYRRKSLGSAGGSAIWRGFRKIQLLFFDFLRWRINTGSNILIGIEPTILGLEESLSPVLISFLHSQGLFTWNKLILHWSSSTPTWMSADDLHLPSSLRQLWASAVMSLDGKGIKQSGTNDILVWLKSKSTMPVSVKDLYAAASLSLQPLQLPLFPMKFWKSSCSLKATLFSWLVFSNRNLTWDVLQKKAGWVLADASCAVKHWKQTFICFFNARRRPKYGMIFHYHMVFLINFSPLYRMLSGGGVNRI